MSPADALLTILLYAALGLAAGVVVAMALATVALALDLCGIHVRRRRPAAPTADAGPSTTPGALSVASGESPAHAGAEPSEGAGEPSARAAK